MHNLIGRTLSHYRIVEKIGEGGMGVVYRAHDERLGRDVAIKVLPEHLAKDPERRERFEREGRTVSSLNHPNICTLHDIGRHDGIDFIVMEYIEGETLASRLERGALPLERALQICMQIADGLDKAHRRGIVHRDLKPGNIMLTKDGAKLLDFGLAKLRAPDTVVAESALATEDKPLTAEGTLLGTVQYMAPEQLEGKEADARTDVFAFGALLYETITGNKAFEGKSQASLISAIMSSEPRHLSKLQANSPPALDRTVAKCLAKDPEERWQTARDLVDELEWIDSGAASETTVVAKAATQASRLRCSFRRTVGERDHVGHLAGKTCDVLSCTASFESSRRASDRAELAPTFCLFSRRLTPGVHIAATRGVTTTPHSSDQRIRGSYPARREARADALLLARRPLDRIFLEGQALEAVSGRWSAGDDL
jgi:serine/threonine protein kinase